MTTGWAHCPKCASTQPVTTTDDTSSPNLRCTTCRKTFAPGPAPIPTAMATTGSSRGTRL